MVFGGITIMLLINAVLGPLVGPLVDRHGARRFLMGGSVLMACGVVGLGVATGPATYALAWAVIGIASLLALSQTALPALSQIAGEQARRAIATTMLFNALSSAIFWPLAAFLELKLGWRGVCLIFGAFHLFLCLPLHSALNTPPASANRTVGADGALKGVLPRRRQFVLAAIALSGGGFVAWGLPVHVIEMMRSFGHSAAFAIALGSVTGVAQVCARGAEMLFGYRLGILSVGIASISLMAIALFLPIAGGSVGGIAIAFAIAFGFGIGSFTIVRVVLPLHLFGPIEYGAMMGKLGAPQNIVFAFAPLIFAAVFHDLGARIALGLAFGMAVLALAAMVALTQFSNRQDIR